MVHNFCYTHTYKVEIAKLTSNYHARLKLALELSKRLISPLIFQLQLSLVLSPRWACNLSNTLALSSFTADR